jgi:hypothetical protein
MPAWAGAAMRASYGPTGHRKAMEPLVLQPAGKRDGRPPSCKRANAARSPVASRSAAW